MRRTSRLPIRFATVGGAAIVLLSVACPVSPAGVLARGQAEVAIPRFTDETQVAGVEHVYDGEWEFFVGGGVAVLDCSGDGRPDLYFAGGVNPASLYVNESPVGGSLRFSRLENAETDLERVTGAYPLDIDNDGLTDLAVLRHGEDILLRGLGDCRFERANEAWSFDGGDAWTTAFSATWEEGATWPTLAFGTYIAEVDDQGLSHCGESRLVRPNVTGDGFGAPTALAPGYCTLSMLFSDWDRSGRRDLRVTNDRHYYDSAGQEQLWRIEPGSAPKEYTTRQGWQPVHIWGMGIASQDLTSDGYPEVYLTSIGSNVLQTLEDGPRSPSFHNISRERQVRATFAVNGGDGERSTAWHPEFDDVNNDGHMDLFISKGNVEAMTDTAAVDPNDLMLGRPDGTFQAANEAAGILTTARTRGAALVDLDLDGLLDLVEVHRRENVSIRRNVGAGDADVAEPMGHWLAVDLEQDGANRDAVGAWIELDRGNASIEREVTVGGGHVSGDSGPTHFGLGDSTEARIRVVWPDGERGPWQRVAADQYVTVQRGAADVKPWP